MKYLVSSSSPRAICSDRKNSLVVPRPNPSAMFAGTEVHERRTWETIPKRSIFGNLSVIRKTSNASSCAFRQTSNSE